MAIRPNRRVPAGLSTKATGVAAVDRALAILASFGKDGDPVSLAELSALTGMYKSTILRLIDSLLKHGYVQRLQDGRYQIGPTPFILGARFQRGIRIGDVVLPLMRILAEESRESIAFYVVHGDMRLCCHRIESDHEVRDHGREGDLFPLARGSAGGILSAFSGARGERFDAIRKDHYYISLAERNSETAGISVPVFGPGQALIGCLTVSGPRSRVADELLHAIRGRILDLAATATTRFGGNPEALYVARESVHGRSAPKRTQKR